MKLLWSSSQQFIILAYQWGKYHKVPKEGHSRKYPSSIHKALRSSWAVGSLKNCHSEEEARKQTAKCDVMFVMESWTENESSKQWGALNNVWTVVNNNISGYDH